MNLQHAGPASGPLVLGSGTLWWGPTEIPTSGSKLDLKTKAAGMIQPSVGILGILGICWANPRLQFIYPSKRSRMPSIDRSSRCLELRSVTGVTFLPVDHPSSFFFLSCWSWMQKAGGRHPGWVATEIVWIMLPVSQQDEKLLLPKKPCPCIVPGRRKLVAVSCFFN